MRYGEQSQMILAGPAKILARSGLLQVWEAGRKALEGRAAFRLPTPTLTELPAELLERGNAVMRLGSERRNHANRSRIKGMYDCG
jgi:hypothetical protein